MTRLDEIRKGFRGLIMAGVYLAILRHDLGDDDMDMEEIMCDAANAAEGIDTCADEPIQEWTNLLSLVEKQQNAIEFALRWFEDGAKKPQGLCQSACEDKAEQLKEMTK